MKNEKLQKKIRTVTAVVSSKVQTYPLQEQSSLNLILNTSKRDSSVEAVQNVSPQLASPQKMMVTVAKKQKNLLQEKMKQLPVTPEARPRIPLVRDLMLQRHNMNENEPKHQPVEKAIGIRGLQTVV